MPPAKKQTLRIAAAFVAVVFLLFALVQFAVLPMLRATRENREIAQGLGKELDKSRDVIGTAPETQRGLDNCRSGISGLAGYIPLPVLGNYLLDMERQIRTACAGMNIQISSVVLHDILDLPGWSDTFKIYRVRVVAQAGINDLARCFYNIQRRNPLVSVETISVMSQEGVPDVHEVSFVVAWLIWSDPDKRPDFLKKNVP